MHIFLYGLSGTGKSTVGKLLAESLNKPFLDLDAQIELDTQPIAQIMAEQGETAFRNLESRTLQEAVSGADKVISLGGGALLREENRLLAEASGKVVLLEADLTTLLARLSQDDTPRPLLAGDLQTKLEALIDDRMDHYDSFSLHVNASQQPNEVTWEIQTLLGTFHVSGMGRGYDVMVEEKGLDRLGEMLTTRGLGSRAMVVSDSNVAPLYLDRAVRSLQEAGIHAKTLVLPAGEAHKTLETVSFLWHGYLDAGLDRSSMVVALGGGVVGDLAGFASSTFMRGITWVNVPTTLLSMVDASIGGKTGFDLLEGKNLIGSFYSPALVLASLNTLDTLPEVEFKSGMAEAVKHGVIADPDLFEDCSVGIEKTMENPGPIVRQAMAVKIKIINQDPYEKNIRAALNLGHTIGHAVELVSRFKIRHGEAVSIGMVAEAQLAERLSVAEKGLTATLVKVLEGLGLPVKIPGNLPRTEIIRAMKMDKKKAGKVVRFSLPVRIGEVSVGIAIENLEEVL